MARDAKGRDFYIATSEEIKAGKTTDVYFLRTLDILKKAGKDRTSVVAEVTAGNLPSGWPWGVFCGADEAPRPGDRDGRSAGGVRGGPQVPRGEDSAHRTRRHVLRRKDGSSPRRRGDPRSHGSATRYTGLPPRQLPFDRAGGPLGARPPRPQGRTDLRVRLGGRGSHPRARGAGR